MTQKPEKWSPLSSWPLVYAILLLGFGLLNIAADEGEAVHMRGTGGDAPVFIRSAAERRAIGVVSFVGAGWFLYCYLNPAKK